MIEYRAMLRKIKNFESGFSLAKGTVIYARETPDGWIGAYYNDKGSAQIFNLAFDDFSIMNVGDTEAVELVVMPDPPTPPERIREENELARRRLESRAKRYRAQADEIDRLLQEVS